MNAPSFAMMTCAVGAEVPLKSEVAASGWRLAFSRPGFVTAKNDQPNSSLPTGTFVRTASHSIGHVKGQDGVQLAAQLKNLLAEKHPDRVFDQLHLWPRDRLPIGKFGFEPEIDEVSKLVADQVLETLSGNALQCQSANQVADPGTAVLDIVLVDPNDWFIGWHVAGRSASQEETMHWPSRWPGGIQPVDPHYEPISRAYFKAAEAMAWSGFPFQRDDLAVEVGSAPGGACGRLLEEGLRVIGIDPAEMDPRIAGHPKFTHHRARAGDLPRRTFRDVKWLLADSNVKPEKTLTTIHHIVTHRDCSIDGMLLTLKLGNYNTAEHLPKWLQTIQQWKPKQVRVRQLARNRCEVCCAIRL